jgi:hypothetical protein
LRRSVFRLAVFLVALAAALPARATFHLWAIDEIFSTANGRIQYIEFVALAGGQQFLSGHTLTASGGASPPRSFTFPQDLPGDTTNRRFLVGTKSFAALGVVTPDYVVPDGFLAVGGGTLTFGEGADTWTYRGLPSDGRTSLNRDATTALNNPRNFANQTGTVSAIHNVQGLWWRSPAGAEAGWGLNLVQQGDVLFVTWFTYGPDGNGMWLVMSEARRTNTNRYAGTIYRTTGPSFNAVPFDPKQVTTTAVGTGTLSFTDTDSGTFSYTVDGVSQSKPITRMIFALPDSTCTQAP